ncbi:sorbosone dehydrogenase family protein, partial [Pseudomonas syringae]
PVDVATGFRGARGKTGGRPLRMTVAPRAALSIADALATSVWGVTRHK